jgi:hypothetical protein
MQQAGKIQMTGFGPRVDNTRPVDQRLSAAEGFA